MAQQAASPYKKEEKGTQQKESTMIVAWTQRVTC